MTTQRPRAIAVIATFHFIIATLGLLYLGSEVLPMVVKTPAEAQDKLADEFDKKLEEQVPGAKAMGYVDLGSNFLFAVLLLAGGIGLLNMRPWGRTVSIAYAVLSLLQKIAFVVYAVVFVLPVLNSGILDEFLREVARQEGGIPAQELEMFLGVMKGVVIFAFVGFPILMMIYPTIVLIVLFRPSVRQAFQQQAAAEDFRSRDDDGYSDYERDRY